MIQYVTNFKYACLGASSAELCMQPTYVALFYTLPLPPPGKTLQMLMLTLAHPAPKGEALL